MEDFAELTLFLARPDFYRVHIGGTSRMFPLSAPPQMMLMPMLDICFMNWLSDPMSSVQSDFSPDSTQKKQP